VVKDRLAQLFDRHGAIELVTPLLAPALTPIDVDQHLAVRLLDSQGNLVSESIVSHQLYSLIQLYTMHRSNSLLME
jgi:hypothetical protein